MKNIIKIYNLTVRFSKFTLDIEIYKKFVEILSKYEEYNKNMQSNS